MQPLHILLLGPPEVRWEGAPLRIPRRVTRMLLFYLAARGIMITRDELINILWDGDDEQTGKLRLRETLNKLRSALPDPSCVLAQNDLVGLDRQKVFVDILAFRDIVMHLGSTPWQFPPEESLPAEIEKVLRQAAYLWRSPRFMAGARILDSRTMDQWFQAVIQQTEESLLRIVDRLAENDIAMGKLDSALLLTRLALAVDDLNEKQHEREIWLHLQMGNLRDAHHAYLKYISYLQKETGSSPGERLQALYRQIQVNEPNLISRHNPDWLIRTSTTTRFVGRLKYLALLRQYYESGSNLVLLGESGQGKTRLLKEFVERLQPAPLILLAQCRIFDTSLPLQPMIDLVKQYIKENDWHRLPRPIQVVFAPLFPEFAAKKSKKEELPGLSAEELRSRLFDALRQWLDVLASAQRMILIVDDAQWADEATLNLLTYLMSRPPFGKNGMLVLMARVEEIPPYLRSMIDALRPTTPILHLGSLNKGEISELASNVLGKQLTPHLTGRLSEDTGGNTFFILETLQALQAQPNLFTTLDQLAELPLAERITIVLKNRLAVISWQARAILEAAAITGTTFPISIIYRASGLSKEEAAEALEELEARYLIEPIQLELPDIRYSFIHDKIREGLLLSLNPLRAQVLHQRVADAIQAEFGAHANLQAGVVALHYELAGEWQAAFPWWVKAVERARQLLGFAEARLAMEHAEKILERHYQNLNETQIYQLYRTWGETAQIALLPDEIVTTIEKLLMFGELRNSALLRGAAYLNMTDLDLIQNQFDQGLTHASQAISWLKKTNDPNQLARARTNLGSFQYLLNQVDAALHTFKEALDMLSTPTSFQQLILRGALHYHLSICYTLNGRPVAGRQHASQALVDDQAALLVDGEIAAYSSLGLANYLLGEYQQARRACERGLELAITRGHNRMVNYLHMYQAMVELDLGQMDAFQAQIAPILNYTASHGSDETLLTTYRLLGDAYLWMRDYPSAVAYYSQSNQEESQHFLAFDHRFRLLMARSLTGEPSDYQVQMLEILHECQELGLGMVSTFVKLAQLIIGVKQKAWVETHQLALDLYQHTKEQESHFIHLQVAQILAVIELNQGLIQPAIDGLEAILQTPRQRMHAWVEVETFCALAAAQYQAGIDAGNTRQRLQQRLTSMEAGCTSPDLLPTFQKYCQIVQQSLDSHVPLSW